MVVFPNAKINIGLQVVGKRPDGYHDLQTIFYPIKVNDALEIIDTSSQTNNLVQFSSSGNHIHGNEQDNICLKAYHLLQHDFPQLTSIQLHLHKHIPTGAGLGGGSADGVFMLQMLNKKFNLQLSKQQLLGYALQLGSDCPFFVVNKPCYATGRGEILKEINIDLSAYHILVVNPGIHINTAAAFRALHITPAQEDLKALIQQPVETWKDHIRNDFERWVFDNYAVVKDIKEKLYAAGASFASMSGSGSTVYGIFKKEIQPVLNFPAGYFLKWA